MGRRRESPTERPDPTALVAAFARTPVPFPSFGSSLSLVALARSGIPTHSKHSVATALLCGERIPVDAGVRRTRFNAQGGPRFVVTMQSYRFALWLCSNLSAVGACLHAICALNRVQARCYG